MSFHDPFMDIYGPYMAIIQGHVWPTYGHMMSFYSPYVVICGHIESYMAHMCPYMGHIWLHMYIDAHIERRMAPYMAIYAICAPHMVNMSSYVVRFS